jgi:hypothetical protein
LANSKITNTVTKTVTLGQGGYGTQLTVELPGAVAPSGPAATGIVVPDGLLKGSITIDGTVSGASGGGTIRGGGIGIDMAASASLVNAGTVTGGGGYAYGYEAGKGGTAVNLRAGGSVTNSGAITGGTGAGAYGFTGGTGGTGAALQGAVTLKNSGTIAGGTGGSVAGYGGNYISSGAGGVGVDLSGGGKATNTGTIAGGRSVQASYSSTGAGGTGVEVSASSFVNDGTIAAGSAAYAAYGTAGAGGSGVVITQSGVFTNAGTITAGNGGSTHYGNAGNGGTGVTIDTGTLTNTGRITGGNGGSGYSGSASSGVGVLIDGGTLSTSGTIAGGSGADAVSFGSAGGTLAIAPDAVFVGKVEASSSADVLDLSSVKGSTAGTLTGALGTEFTGFTSVAVNKGTNWTLAGSNALGSTSTLIDNGTLQVSGAFADAGQISVVSLLEVTGAGSALIHAVSLDGGTVTGDAAGSIAVGDTAGAAGAITIDAGASVTGFGRIGGAAVVNNGSIVAEGGTLTLATGLSGAGTVQINSGAVLVVDSSVSGNAMVFGGPATLLLVDPKAFAGTIGSFGSGDVIDVGKLAASSLAYANGTLTLEHGKTVLDTLHFSGSFTAADFSFASDGKGGTDISFVSSPAAHAAALGLSHADDASAAAVHPIFAPHFG